MTIRRLAAFMGISPMTIYSYARSKDELLDLMTSAALGAFDFDPEVSSTQTWKEQLYVAFMALHRVFRANPVAVELITMPRAITGREVDRIREKIVNTMDGTGIPREKAIDVFNTVGAYIMGVVTVELARATRAHELREHIASLPLDEFPHLSRSSEAWARPIPTEMIETGIRNLIDGLTAD